MKHTTNDPDTFIEVAEDCPAQAAEAPPLKELKSTARLEYEMLSAAPYEYTSDDVIYETKGRSKGLNREEFFSKGQPCFRASALTKRYGWGVHSDEKGQIAIYPVESDDYKKLVNDRALKHVKAISSSKK